MDEMVVYLVDVVQRDSQECGRKAKKPRQGEEEDINEGSVEEHGESDKESEEELEGKDEISMPKEVHKFSLLKCEEVKRKGSVWSAFFCEPQYK